MRLLGVSLVIAFVMTVSGTAQYKLEYKAGGSAHYTANTRVEIAQTMMGQESRFSITANQFMTVSSVPAGDELVFSTTVDSGESITIMPTGDTNRTAPPSMGKVKETRIKPNGEEISSKWLDSTFAASQAGQMKDMGSFFFKLPSSKVNAGETWKQTRTDTVGTAGGQGKIIVSTNTDYKLIGKESIDGVSCVRIEFSGKVIMKGTASMNGMDLAIDGNGKLTGTAYFDYTGGKVMKVAGTSDQDITMASAGDHPMTVPMTQKSTYELSFAK